MAVIRLTRKLWASYLRQNRIKALKLAAENRLRRKRESLIVEHMPRAVLIARQVWHRFNRGSQVTLAGNANGRSGYAGRIALEDMISCAYLGLVEAAGRWDPSRGDFAKYSYLRIRGAIVDAHRRQAYVETQHGSIDEWPADAEEDAPAHDLASRFLRDRKPLADEMAGRGQIERLTASIVDRILPDDERAVIREALAGESVASIGRSFGHSPAWARAKLAAARDKVAAAVQGKAA